MVILDLEVGLEVNRECFKDLLPHELGRQLGARAACLPTATGEHKTSVMVVGEIAKLRNSFHESSPTQRCLTDRARQLQLLVRHPLLDRRQRRGVREESQYEKDRKEGCRQETVVATIANHGTT